MGMQWKCLDVKPVKRKTLTHFLWYVRETNILYLCSGPGENGGDGAPVRGTATASGFRESGQFRFQCAVFEP